MPSEFMSMTVQIIAVCFIISTPAHSLTQNGFSELQLPTDDSTIRLENTHFQIIHDQNSTIPFSEIENNVHQFQSVDQLGGWDKIRGGQIWVKFTLKNSQNTHKHLVLDTERRSLQSATFYSPSSTGTYDSIQFGDQLSYSQRQIKTMQYALPLSIPPNASLTYYVRWQRVGVMDFTAKIVTPADLIAKQDWNMTRSYLTTGLGLGLTIYNLMLFFYTREKAYIHYSLFVFLFTLFFSFFDGTGYKLWPDGILLNYKFSAIGISLLLASYFLTQFSRTYLNSKKQLPRFDRVLSFWSIILLSLILIYHFPNIVLMQNIMLLALIVNFLALLILGIVSLKMGQQDAYIYVTAFSIFLIGSLVTTLLILDVGLIPNNTFTLEASRIGFCVNLLLLSTGLARNINRLKGQQLRSKADANAARESERLKSQFLTTMSHEIRTPMNGVLGMVDLLEQTSLNTQQKKFVQIISRSGNLLLNVINDILDFSKIEAGKMEIEKIAFDLEKVTSDCAEIFNHRAKELDIQFIASISPKTPTIILGDPNRLSQIIVNFLSNAFKFTTRGSIQLHAREVTNSENEKALRFTVADTGMGLTSTHQQTLFGAFTQADASTSRKFGGTGLGLAICKRLSNLMGGEIGVTSDYGKGSTFWLEIPLQTPPVNLLPLEIIPADHLCGKHLLIVDDNEIFLSLIIGIIEDLEMSYTIAKSAEQAEAELNEAVRQGKVFDIALIDYMLPKKNGLTLAGEMNKHNSYSDIPVVLVSAQESVSQRKDIIAAGIKVSLEKPVTSIELRDAFRLALGVEVSPSPKNETDLSMLNVLIAEDNEVNQFVTIKLLERLGIIPVLVNNGLEAVESYKTRQASDKPLDIILMDCEMPVMDGYTAAKTICSLEQELKVPELERVQIIALSAHAMSDSKKKALDSGMVTYLTKPLSLQALTEELEHCMEKDEQCLEQLT